MWRGVVFALGMALLGARGLGAQALLVENPGFEQGLEGWTSSEGEGGAVVVDEEIAQGGSRSLCMRHAAASGTSSVMQEALGVRLATRLVASVWVKAQDVRGAGDGALLSCRAGGSTWEARGPTLDPRGECAWQQVQLPFYADGTTPVRVELALREVSGTVWFDDVEVRHAPVSVKVDRLNVPIDVDGTEGGTAWVRNYGCAMVWCDDGSRAAERVAKFAHDRRTLYALARVPAPATAGGRDGPRVTFAIAPEPEGERGLVFHVAPDGDAAKAHVLRGQADASAVAVDVASEPDGAARVGVTLPWAAFIPEDALDMHDFSEDEAIGFDFVFTQLDAKGGQISHAAWGANPHIERDGRTGCLILTEA